MAATALHTDRDAHKDAAWDEFWGKISVGLGSLYATGWQPS